MPQPKKGPQSQAANRTGIQDLLQKQAQGRLRTNQARDGMDALDLPPETGPASGAIFSDTDLGPADDVEGDDLFQDDPEALDPPLTSEALEPEVLERPPAVLALPDILGSLPPVVLFRLAEDGDAVRAQLCVKPSARNAVALEELKALLENCFDRGLRQLSIEERLQLLGGSPATITRRLMLLVQLAVKGSDKVKSESGASRLQFKPNDRGLERYAGKLVALPDGTPFSLRLVLLDLRGRKGKDTLFDRLPPAIKLLALRRALEREEQQGEAVSDYVFGALIQQALQELLGIEDVERPSEDQVRRRFRDNFKRSGRDSIFPEKNERQRRYDLMKAAPPTAPEART